MYQVDCYTHENKSNFPENSYDAKDTDSVKQILDDVTNDISGIGRLVITIKKKADTVYLKSVNTPLAD